MQDPFKKIHILSYATTTGAITASLVLSSPLYILSVALIAVGIVVNIELVGISRMESFDPNPILLTVTLLVATLLEYIGTEKNYVVSMAIAVSTLIIASSYWENESFRKLYTPLLTITLFTAPLAGILLKAQYPFLLTLLSILETSIIYSLNTWETDELTHMTVHLLTAIALYGFLHLMTGEGVASLLFSATYFIKYIASQTRKLAETYPGIDPIVKTMLGGLLS